MAIDVKLHHLTRYRYDRPVTLGPQVVRLRPAPHCRTEVLSYSLRVEPADHFINWQQDAFGNYLARLVFPEKTTEFCVEVNVVARLATINPFDYFLEPEVTHFPFSYGDDITEDLRPYLRVEAPGPLLQAWLDEVDQKSKVETNTFLVQLNQRLQRDIKYLIRLEPGVQTSEETLEKRSGSCRDSAWLLVQILRHLGLAARFVSGYLIQLKADVKPLDGPGGTEVDFTDLHAWTEVYLPGAGWVGLDPTSGLFASEGHLPLAATPEPRSAAPISGGVDPSEVEFDFEMDVRRIFEAPRTTLPYSEEQWAAIDALGKAIDERLVAGDVRLSMGGEPTFISAEDFESPQWTTEAQGKEKRERAEDLLRRLYDHYGKGGLLHYGQGKWYPGEQLPRWAYSCLWRRDFQPIWENPKLLADIREKGTADEVVAEQFSRTLCGILGLTDEYLRPGYEDNYYYLWRERRLPVNVDPINNHVRDPLERERLARVFEQGLDKVVGYALPLERGYDGAGQYCWLTGPWPTRPNTLYLIPGDSPMGLRLPLDSLPWAKDPDNRAPADPSMPFEPPPLPKHQALARQYVQPVTGELKVAAINPWGDYFSQFGGQVPPHLRPRPTTLAAAYAPVVPGQPAPWIVRTALCIEPRGGNLFVFLPPVAGMEDYIDLLAAIEATAAQLDQPVIIEGYLPPPDPRIETLKVTPDPGVIEVNIHPALSWAELTERTTFLYEAARQSRLTSEKFQLDGRHTGTGGGNHIVIGGPTVTDSPLLRRPKLLGSLLNYWLQHPGLSYLFSGMFIGPTSQAPRLDEARSDSLFELEVAHRELDRQMASGHCPPWLVDRIYRDLLTDVTGNTHRAEFCIDKLFSPDSASGRLGLLELRAFEMPPHARMSLVQQVILRGLVARFWDHPYEPQRLVRWGTDLHDRWMLPHFLGRDLEDVAHDLTSWGMPFDAAWLKPHLEFRCPLYGQINVRDIHLELRQALEPWHVLGEEAAGGATARYVDSSVERLQVKVCGLTPERFAVACNGQPVPLAPTGTVGEYVAGVRFRAWQPPRCLHPTIPVDTPLVFDVVDLWNRVSLGGCRYHVSHPGGRSYDVFPVNAYEAEGRRLSRFETTGHTTGILKMPPLVQGTADFPITLDLRGPVTQAQW